jgi:tRNA-splicing ligase RtcB
VNCSEVFVNYYIGFHKVINKPAHKYYSRDKVSAEVKKMEYKKIGECLFEFPKKGNMNVPARIYATERILNSIENLALEQLVNTAELPGIQKYALALPDCHTGYGFPIGGVAAFDAKENGIVSPGGIGFDINCGIRLIRTDLLAKDIRPRLPELMDELFRLVPAGVGGKGNIRLERKELAEMFSSGAKYMAGKGFGWKKDLERIEEKGRMKGADPEKVSDKAFQRGMPQAGTLGSGNHFIEVQAVEEIFDSAAAKVFGLFKGQAVVMLHSGSRGAGHQIATDYIEVMLRAMEKYGIKVNDRQLACAPIESEEGRDYLGAMWCGVNYAFANRQAMTHWVRQGFEKVLGSDAEKLGMEVVYDICHNVAKFESHEVDGKKKELLVHRKGATRAMPAGRPENPKVYAKTGHPAIIPGSMGTASYVLVGTEKGLEESFASVCHGAGRTMSRHEAMRRKSGAQVKKELEARGEVVRGKSEAGLAEEMPEAYKDIDEVIESVVLSGIGKKVSRHSPLAVMKG